MKQEITIVAEPRTTRGKNEARRLRVAGRIPAVVYGAGKDSTAVSVAPKEINRILYSTTGHNTILNVEIEGQDNSPAMIVDWQFDPVKDHLLHVDLERIDLTKKMVVKVPVHLTGEPMGVKTQGGLLEVINREIELECLPTEIPEFIGADVSELLIGDNLRAGALEIPEKVTLVSAEDTVICHCIELRVSDTDEEAETEDEEGGEESEESTEKSEG